MVRKKSSTLAPDSTPKCDLRSHSRHFEQTAEQAPLAVGAEAEQNVRILAHHQVREQRHGLTGGRQPVECRHRRFQLVADAVDIQHQRRRLLHRQPALEEADHPPNAACSRTARAAQRMADRCGQGVGGIGRHRSVELEQTSHHQLHLGLFGIAGIRRRPA